MSNPENSPTPDLSQLPPPTSGGTPLNQPSGGSLPHRTNPSSLGDTPRISDAAKRKQSRVWLVIVVALILGGGGTAGYMLMQESTRHEAALTEHADAITTYETAWSEFERQNADTRDDQAQTSSTSLDNSEEVNEAFNAAVAAADELQHIDFGEVDSNKTNEQTRTDTQRIDTATQEVQAVTKQLAEASALFLDSHREATAKSLSNEIANAEQVYDASGDTGDADLKALLEQAISDARDLVEDPKAHPTDLRMTMENLNTLTRKVGDSAGPSAESISDGEWGILPGDILQTGGATGLTVDGIQISMKNNPSLSHTGPDVFEYSTPIWTKQDGCLRADGNVHRHTQLWFCPAGTPVPSEAHDNIYSLKSGDQTEDLSRDRLIGNWFMYLQ